MNLRSSQLANFTSSPLYQRALFPYDISISGKLVIQASPLHLLQQNALQELPLRTHDRDLLSVDCAEYPGKACWFSPVRKLSYVPDMMHDDLRCAFSANAARLSWLGACFHLSCHPYSVYILSSVALEGVSVLRPVLICVEGDFSVFLPCLLFDDNAEGFPEAFENFGK